MKLRLLDLFSGAGGAAVGYARAGFEVVGVDVINQPHYPFEFHRLDATIVPYEEIGEFNAIHASPPCQDHMRVGQHPTHGTGWMLDHTRERLVASGLPWVIENVPGADMRVDYRLCGCRFNLPIRRVRYFETSWQGVELAPSCVHDSGEVVLSVTGTGCPTWVSQKLGRYPTKDEWNASMGIDWMSRKELSQAIPPAYTQFIGEQLLAHLAVST